MGKPTTNLTHGGRCEGCDDVLVCCVCGVGATADTLLYYSQGGDHDHLVCREGALVLEAHGRLMCAEHYLADAAALGITREALGWPEEPVDDPS